MNTCGLESHRYANKVCGREATTFVNVRLQWEGKTIYPDLPICALHSQLLYRGVVG